MNVVNNVVLDYSEAFFEWKYIGKIGQVDIYQAGDIHHSESYHCVEQIPAASNYEVSSLSTLIQHEFAGDGLLILHKDNCVGIVRPPFSELPIYYTRHDGTLFLFSNISQFKIFCSDMKLNIQIDYEYLWNYMSNERHVSFLTGVANVNEILSGSTLFVYQQKRATDVEVSHDYMPALIKNLPDPRSLNAAQYACHVRTLTEKAIECKSAGIQKLAISASGGFDSSTIATLLAQQQDIDTQLIHLYSSRVWQTDERSYFNVLLEKTDQQASYIDLESVKDRQLRLPHAHAAFRPSKMFATTGINHATRKRAQDLKCDRLLSGDGGDQLFLCYGANDIIIPVLYETPFRSVLHALTNVAIYQNISIWTLLADNLLGTARSKMESNLNGSRGYKHIKSLFMPNDKRPPEPLPNYIQYDCLDTTRKFQLIALRCAEINAARYDDLTIDERKPFLYWPLVKLMLSCPRTLHHANGRDRGLGRLAYNDVLPPEIIARVDKSSDEALIKKFDYAALVSRLQSSVLVQRGVLNGAAIQKSAEQGLTDNQCSVIVKAVYVEKWMQETLN